MLNNSFFLNQNYFSEDIFLKDSTLFKYAFYYELLKFFKINIDYDLHAFFLYFVLHVTSFYFLFLTIKKIFPKFDTTLAILIILAFSAKGISLYVAKVLMIQVGEEVKKKMQFDMLRSLISADTELIDQKHSGKFISNLTYDVQHITNL